MEHIGFIGLGIMGKPMSQHLLKAGYPLTVLDRVPEFQNEIVAAGAQGRRIAQDMSRSKAMSSSRCCPIRRTLKMWLWARTASSRACARAVCSLI